MIEEDYVSFETAKLLKENGFDAECHSHYYPCHYPDGSIQYHKYRRTETVKNKCWYDIYSLKNLPADHYLAPTLQMAMKWLREEKGIAIIPIIDSILDYEKFLWDIKIVVAKTNETFSQGWVYETPESGYDRAIRYCLENLV